MTTELNVWESEMIDLTELSMKLNSETDALNEMLETFESSLASMKLGVSVFLDGNPRRELGRSIAPLEAPNVHEDAVMTVRYRVVGYAKIGDEWQVAVQRREVHRDSHGRNVLPPFEGRATPLLSAPRHIRVGAAGLLDELVQGLIDRTKELIREIEVARDHYR